MQFCSICDVLIMILLNVFFMTDLKSRYDEEKSLKEAADQRLAKLTEQLQKEKQENERLQTELVQHILDFALVFFLLSLGLRHTLFFLLTFLL